jgi:hypothetical protein
MRRRCHTFLILLSSLSLSACGTQGVSLEQLTGQDAIRQVSNENDAAGIAKLVETAQNHSVVVDMLPYSKITITPQAVGSTTNTDKGQSQDFSITASKIGNNKSKFNISIILGEVNYWPLVQVTPINNFFSKNLLTVTKYGTTDIPTVIETQFTDLTKTRVDEISGIITSALKVFVPAPPAPPPPPPPSKCSKELPRPASVIIDSDFPHSLIDEEPCWYVIIQSRNESPKNLNYTMYRYVYVDRFLKDPKIQAPVWPVTVCKDITLVLMRNGTPYLSTPLTIIDPLRIRLIGLPEQGKIATRPLCGADMTNTPSDRYAVVFDAMSSAETGFLNARDQWRKIK